jgi:hypothetical protein
MKYLEMLKDLEESLSDSNRSDAEVDVSAEASRWVTWVKEVAPTLPEDIRREGEDDLQGFLWNPWR